MTWISLLLQLLTLRRSMNEGQALLASAKSIAEASRRALVAALVLAVAALFFFSGLLVAVVELGLQIDRAGALSYSGLMVSATILNGVGLLLVFASWLLGREPTPPPAPPPSAGENRVKDLLEEFAVGFLTELIAKRKPEGERQAGNRD